MLLIMPIRILLNISYFLISVCANAEVTIDGSRVVVHHTDEKEPHPLALHHVPICVTFAIFEVSSAVDTGWGSQNREKGRR